MKEEMAIAAPPPSSSDANNLTATTETETESDDCSTTDELTESFRSFENFIKRKLEITKTSDEKIVDGEDVDDVNEKVKVDEVVEGEAQIVAIQTDGKSSLQPQFGYFMPLPVDLMRKRVKRCNKISRLLSI